MRREKQIYKKKKKEKEKELLQYALNVKVYYSAYVHFLKYKNLDVFFYIFFGSLGVLSSAYVKI